VRPPTAQTPIQQAISLSLGAYLAALRLLPTAAERDTLRDVVACRLAHDWLAEQGLFREDEEQAA
jgi:hypothetical protein